MRLRRSTILLFWGMLLLATLAFELSFGKSAEVVAPAVETAKAAG